MPLYEYHCHHCDTTEVRWIMDTSEITAEHCSHCGRVVEKLISPPSLRFEGDGWQTPKATKEKRKATC